MHSRCSALPFSLSLILPPAGAKPPDALPCRRCPQGCASRYALRCGLHNCGPSSCRSCMPCKMSCTTSRLSSPLVSAVLGFVQVVLCNMITACNNSRLSRYLARPQTRQKLLLAPQPRIASLRPIRPQLLDGLQALLPN